MLINETVKTLAKLSFIKIQIY